jgi:hypothetical protein
MSVCEGALASRFVTRTSGATDSMLAGRVLVRRSARLFSTAAAAETTVAPSVPLLINGKFIKSVSTAPGVPVRNPATQELLATTPIATAGEMRAAVDAAKKAFPAWSATSVSNRARVMFKLQALIRQHDDELAAILSSEHGKTIDDAKGDIFRGLEVVEHACSATSLQMGETTAGVAGSTDVHSYRLPLGVCAGIAPFNFPAMIPLWMFPMGVVTGNTYVLKPSERVPLTAMRLAQLATEAGLPDGVLNIIHGTHHPAASRGPCPGPCPGPRPGPCPGSSPGPSCSPSPSPSPTLALALTVTLTPALARHARRGQLPVRRPCDPGHLIRRRRLGGQAHLHARLRQRYACPGEPRRYPYPSA